MKIALTFWLSLIVFLSLFSESTYSQESSKNSTIYPYLAEQSLTFGQSFNPNKLYSNTINVVRHNGNRYGEHGFLMTNETRVPGININFYSAESLNEIYNSTKLSLAAEAKNFALKASINSSYATNLRVTENSVHVIVRAEMVFPKEGIDTQSSDIVVAEKYISLAKSNPVEFRNRHGSKFVSAQMAGYSASVIYSFDGLTESEKKELTLAASASYNGLASGTLQFNQIYTRLTKTKKSRLQILSSIGTPPKVVAALNEVAFTKDLAKIKNLLNAIKTSEYEQVQPLRFYQSNLFHLMGVNDPFEIFEMDQEEALTDIYTAIVNMNFFINELREPVADPEAFIWNDGQLESARKLYDSLIGQVELLSDKLRLVLNAKSADDIPSKDESQTFVNNSNLIQWDRPHYREPIRDFSVNTHMEGGTYIDTFKLVLNEPINVISAQVELHSHNSLNDQTAQPLKGPWDITNDLSLDSTFSTRNYSLVHENAGKARDDYIYRVNRWKVIFVYSHYGENSEKALTNTQIYTIERDI